jgi:hypothetical protein
VVRYFSAGVLDRCSGDTERGLRGQRQVPRKGDKIMSIGTILIILLIIFLLGGFSGRFGGYGYGFGHGGVGIIGLILIVVVILMLLGRL